MEAGSVIPIVQESLYLILVFGAVLGYGMLRGKQSLTNLILALYFALLISLEFPYYDQILGADGGKFSDSLLMIVVFVIFTGAAIFLFERLMRRDPSEAAFEEFGKKVALSVLAAVLIMAYSYHVLPITEFLTPGSPIQALFGPESHFFWWLLVPLAGLLFL